MHSKCNSIRVVFSNPSIEMFNSMNGAVVEFIERKRLIFVTIYKLIQLLGSSSVNRTLVERNELTRDKHRL